MPAIKTDLRNTRESAKQIRFEPNGSINATNVQDAITQVGSQPPTISPTPVTAAQSPFNVPLNAQYLAVDTSGGPITINLQASALRNGVPLRIKDVSGNASTNAISVVPNGAELVDKLAPFPIASDFGGVDLYPQTGGYTVWP